MKSRNLILVGALVALAACSQQSEPPATPATSATAMSDATPQRANPLLAESTLPFQAPPFDQIRNEDFEPAFEAGMREKLAEVAEIAGNPEPPTFENTLVSLEKTGATLRRVEAAFDLLTSDYTNDTLNALMEKVAPKLAANKDAIYLDDKLFQRIAAVYDARDSLNLDPESRRLLEWQYQQFVHRGARLSDADKATLKDLNQRESTLSAQFVNKLQAAANAGALVVDDAAKLAGLGEGAIAAAARDAKDRGLDGKWVLVLQNTTQQPALASLDNRDTRKALFDASWTRAEKGDANDTRATILEIAKIRAEKARLLGFPDFAAWTLDTQMAKTPEHALTFMRDLVPATVAKARSEAKDIQQAIKADGNDFELQPWDWDYYAEKVRKAKYDLDESQIKPYFELDNVLKNGVFHAATELYGITFKERTDLPTWNSDVRVFEVFDADGSSLALFYCDYFKRDNKNGGAWMDNLVVQSKLLGTKPVIYNAANFTKPADGQPALLSWDDVTTLFHEFGHALHGFFADQQYPSLSGTDVARDFVEFPSQFNEHWAAEPSVFANYAKHHETGEPMPKALVDKIEKAAKFNQGYALLETLSAAMLDMSWHTGDKAIDDVDTFEAAALEANGTDLAYVPPRYRSSYFLHIWGNGYAAGYYAYLWTEMLDHDAWQWFQDNGGLNRKNGQRFRDMILSRGNSEDLATMFRDFYGRDPDVGPMLKARGLK